MGLSQGKMYREHPKTAGAEASDGNQMTARAEASDGNQMNDCPDISSDERKKWRSDDIKIWDDQAVFNLRKDITEYIEDLKSLDDIEIVLCGGTGEGKSSLINNCIAAITGEYGIVARHAQGDTQVTIQYNVVHAFIKENGTMRQLPLKFSDTRGFSESKAKGAPVEAIKACILGNVNNAETIDPKVSDESWRNREKVKCKASYIFLVADANIVPDDGKLNSVQSKKRVYQNMRDIIQFSHSEGLDVAAFLTMCDRLDSEVERDVSNLHYSRLVETKVKAFHKIFGIPENRIFPVVNYTRQVSVTNEMAVQMLIALRSCLLDIRAKFWAKPK